MHYRNLRIHTVKLTRLSFAVPTAQGGVRYLANFPCAPLSMGKDVLQSLERVHRGWIGCTDRFFFFFFFGTAGGILRLVSRLHEGLRKSPSLRV